MKRKRRIQSIALVSMAFGAVGMGEPPLLGHHWSNADPPFTDQIETYQELIDPEVALIRRARAEWWLREFADDGLIPVVFESIAEDIDGKSAESVRAEAGWNPGIPLAMMAGFDHQPYSNRLQIFYSKTMLWHSLTRRGIEGNQARQDRTALILSLCSEHNTREQNQFLLDASLVMDPIQRDELHLDILEQNVTWFYNPVAERITRSGSPESFGRLLDIAWEHRDRFPDYSFAEALLQREGIRDPRVTFMIAMYFLQLSDVEHAESRDYLISRLVRPLKDYLGKNVVSPRIKWLEWDSPEEYVPQSAEAALEWVEHNIERLRDEVRAAGHALKIMETEENEDAGEDEPAAVK